MDVNRALHIAVATLLIAALSVLSSAQAGGKSYDPAAGKAAARTRDGFIDFILKRINPADHNYGECLNEGRAMLLDESVRNGYFWSNLVAMGLLGCLFLIIIYQHRLQTRRDWTTAEIVAEYEQVLGRCNAQLDQLTKSNHELNSVVATFKESALRPASKPRTSSTAAESQASSTHSAPLSQARLSSEKTATDRRASTATAPAPAPPTPPFKSDIVARMNSLEQQLACAQEDNKQLRQRIAEGDRRLELEQQKNRQLKGA